MADEKRTRGRPRIYATNAERKKAYRERKKAEYQALENKLEAITEIKDSDLLADPILSLTYADIKNLDTKDLYSHASILNSKIKSNVSLKSPIETIIGSLKDYQNKLNTSTKLIIQDIKSNFLQNELLLYHVVLKNLIDFEIMSRENKQKADYELDLLEAQIKQLEEEIANKKELIVASNISQK